MIRPEKLDFWIKHDLNVLFVGKHGVGKTSIVKDAFDRAGLKWHYFSASTMDPWVDFIGVPKEQKTEEGTPYLDLVRPLGFQNDTIEAIFFDEFNRSHKKVRNAVMELLQFKSINGKKFNNLKIIWAAINPEDDETEDYDVEKLDAAQADRFQVYSHIPYKPDLQYFTDQYDEETARSAISWWTDLPDDIKNDVSPRRLDYALDLLRLGGDIHDVLPEKSNISKLLTVIKTGPISDILEKILADKDKEKGQKFLSVKNNYGASINWINAKQDRKAFFFPLLPSEKLSSLAASNNSALELMLKKSPTEPAFASVLSDILGANTNKKVVSAINKAAKNNKGINDAIQVRTTLGTSSPEIPHSNESENCNLQNVFSEAEKVLNVEDNSTIDRNKVLDGLRDNLPATLTAEEGYQVLSMVNRIAMRSQAAAFQKIKNIMGMVNHCINQIHKETDDSWAEMYKQNNDKLYKIVERISGSKAGESLFCPESGAEYNEYLECTKPAPEAETESVGTDS